MINFKDIELDEETKAYQEELKKKTEYITKQILTNPIVNKWWKEQMEKFRLEMLHQKNEHTL